MNPAPSLAFPSSRTLGSWWRQLAPFRPRALWVAHLLLHRVEALVRQTCPHPLDRFTRLLLETLSPAPATLEQVSHLLPLDRATLRRVLRGLETEGLAQCDAAGVWQPTDLGRQARRQGLYLRAGQERRTFFFVEPVRPDRPPAFVSLDRVVTVPWPADGAWHFDVERLRECLRQSADWKQRHGFPAEVEEVLSPLDPPAASAPADGEEGTPSGWERVILDRPERLLAVLVPVAPEKGGEQLLGFEVRPKGWSLSASPALHLASGGADVFPEIAADPPPERWRQTWKAWAEANGLTAEEADVVALERRDHRLRVIVPRAVGDRLRATRAEAFKGEVWLLAGEERVRAAALLEVKETTSHS